MFAEIADFVRCAALLAVIPSIPKNSFISLGQYM